MRIFFFFFSSICNIGFSMLFDNGHFDPDDDAADGVRLRKTSSHRTARYKLYY